MKKPPIGVVIFGLILIGTSVEQLFNIPSYSDYRIINQDFPSNMMGVRFIVSYALRIVGLITGVGVISLNEFSRKALLGLSVFSIVTIFWRHTYGAFFLATQQAVLQVQKPGMELWPVETLTWLSLIARCAVDVGFAGAAIYYFSRPMVKKHFVS